MYFELDLGHTVLSTHPQIAGQTNSWRTPVWHFPEAEKLEPGDQCTVHFNYNESKGSRLAISMDAIKTV
jgi:hypothetical protein